MSKSYPAAPYNFTVYIQAAKMGFSKISNIEYSVETESFVEGGLNDYVHSLRVPTSTEKVMVFERGVLFSTIKVPVVEDTTFQLGKVGTRIGHDIIIMVLDANRQVKKTYTVSGGIVKSWSLSELNASSSQVLIERFEVIYQKLEAKTEKNALASTASKALPFSL